jgi:hypothetical protein
VTAAQKKIKPSNLPPSFFQDIYEPINLSHLDRDEGGNIQDEAKSKTLQQIEEIMLALQDISRETVPGNLRVAHANGTLENRYLEKNLEIAYDVFQDLVEHDLDRGIITMDVLKLARDPPSALENVVERMQALDLEQMNDPSKHKLELHDQVRKLMEESGKDPIDKETMKQIAINIASKDNNEEVLRKLKNNLMIE